MVTASYNVKVEGLEELQGRLRRYPQMFAQEAAPTMRWVTRRLADNIGMHTPVYLDRLRPEILRSPKIRTMAGDVRGVVDSGDIPYALAMELGPPARWPKMDRLREWCRVKLGDAEAAFAVGRALAEGRSRSQRNPPAMFARGFMKTRAFIRSEFLRLRNRLVKRLAGKL